MSMRRNILIAILASLAFAPPSWADDENTEFVNRVLKQMSTAVRELNYRGLFTYEVGGSLDTYKIVHRVHGDTEFERLRKLNGSEREILRAGHTTGCLSRGDELLRGILRSAGATARLRDNYDFYLTGDERIADRSAVVVQIMPRDQHRFGYTLAVDRKSGLPLKAMRVSTDKRVMERIQFVELTVGEAIAEDELEAGSEHYQLAANDLIACQADDDKDPARSSWETRWLPSGFVYAGERKTEGGDYMLTYTDGLATFSVFIGPPNSRPLIEGRAQIGATVAYVNQRVWSQGAHSVTVVGEIPFATAQRVLAALEPRQ